MTIARSSSVPSALDRSIEAFSPHDTPEDVEWKILQRLNRCSRSFGLAERIPQLARRQVRAGARRVVTYALTRRNRTMETAAPVSAKAEKSDSVALPSFRCKQCNGADVETCLPAFFKTNDDLQFVSVDLESCALSYYCNTCEDSVTVVDATGREDSGRWGLT